MSFLKSKKLGLLAAGITLAALALTQGCSSDATQATPSTGGTGGTGGSTSNGGSGGKAGGSNAGSTGKGGSGSTNGGSGNAGGEAGVGGEAPGAAGDSGSCVGADNCYSCAPKTNDQFLNHCVSGGCPATFDNSTSPALGSVVKLCSDSSVTVELTKPVLCSSIAADGSDFYITPFVAISGATGMNCVNGNGYTSQVTIHFSGLAPIGKYVLHTRQGTDGNTLVDFCNNTLNTQLLSASLSFIVPPPAPVRFLPADTVKCFYSTIPISPLNEFTSYQWSTGETTPVIHVIDPGPYTLMATDSNGCVGIDSIVIKDSTCPEYIYLPSAFTPNADGRNDLFRPKFAGAVIHFRFSIYDRWGRKVFESSDPGRGWDGSIGGKTLPAGTYVWVCAYRLFKRPEEVQKGTVMLVR